MGLYGQARRDWENAYKREKRAEINEIGPLPECADLGYRSELEKDPPRWLREILPDIFFTDFTRSQLRFIDLAWQAIVDGAWKNLEAYRGFGKTSILSGLLFKSLCEGLVRHALYITSEGGASATQASNWFASALYDDYHAEGDDARLFTRLYPEISVPLQKREGKPLRPLTVDGTPLKIELKSDRIVFPNVPGARCAGSLLRFTSISSGGIRGANHIIPGGGSFRVRVVMLDDVQNDATAKSAVEVEAVMATIQKTIRGLAGRKKDGSRESLTVLSAITQNQPGDVAERLLNEVPEFGTVILPFVTSLPNNFDAWLAYRKKRDEVMRKEPIERAREILSGYYRDNIKQLTDSVEVDDPRLCEAWQVDATHYAVDYWAASETSFWCEFQNDARRANAESAGGLTPIEVARKQRFNAEGIALKRRWIPNDADILTAHIDCGEHYLNYQITAFSNDFKTAHVVDFGVFPEQPDGVASKKRFVNDLQEVYQVGDKFDRLHDAVFDLLLLIFEGQYFDEYGEPVELDDATEFEQHAHPRGQSSKRFCRLALCGVDCGDGEMEMALWAAIDDFHKYNRGQYFGRAIPTYGVEAAARLMRYYPLKTGEWRRQKRAASGLDWIENAESRKTVARSYPNVYASLTYDANTAKTRRDATWKLPIGRDGAATICDCTETPEELMMFSRHQTAEEYKTTRKSGLEYRRWAMKKPRVSDNEFLDTDAGCRVLAEYVGCSEDLRDNVRRTHNADDKRLKRSVYRVERRTRRS